MLTRILASVALVAVAIPAIAMKEISTHETWTVFTDDPGMCLARGAASKVAPAVPDRKETYVQVTIFPMMNFKDEVFVIPGYTYASGAPIAATVDGGETFSLKDDGYKSLADDADKSRLVAAMRGGKTLVVKGRTDSGKDTSDSFSLAGFAEAYAEVAKLCSQ